VNNTEEGQVLPLSFVGVGRRLETSGSNGSDLYSPSDPKQSHFIQMYTKKEDNFVNLIFFFSPLKSNSDTVAHSCTPAMAYSIIFGSVGISVVPLSVHLYVPKKSRSHIVGQWLTQLVCHQYIPQFPDDIGASVHTQ
jgi:hypothetical protein